MIKQVVKFILPPGSVRRGVVARYARKLGVLGHAIPDVYYAEWMERAEPYIWSQQVELSYHPKISIIVPLYNTPSRYLLPMVYSVINQTYPNWELILVNASTDQAARRRGADCIGIDTRIRVIEVEHNEGIGGNTNIGLQHAKGAYVALLDHDDLLAPQALYEVAVTLQTEPVARPQLIYSDEDKLYDSGEHRFDPLFKPDWSPQIMRHVNYLNHLTVINIELLKKVGNYRKGFDGAQDFDLFLRLIDEKPIVAHIPKILYHWRAARNSTAHDFSSKKNVLDAGEQALRDHLQRCGQVGKVSALPKQPGFYKVDYTPNYNEKVALVLAPTNDRTQQRYLAQNICRSLRKNKLTVELYVMESVAASFQAADLPQLITLQTYNAQTLIACLTEITATTQAASLVIFGAAATPKTKGWLESLVGIIDQVPSVGVAAPVLLQPKSDIIASHGLVKLNEQYVDLFRGMPIGMNSYLGNSLWGRNVDCLKGDVLAMKLTTYRSFFANSVKAKNRNTFSPEQYKKVTEQGLEVVVLPSIKLYYDGEMLVRASETRYANANLVIRRQEPGVTRAINVPPEWGSV